MFPPYEYSYTPDVRTRAILPSSSLPPEYRALSAALTPPDELILQWRTQFRSTIDQESRGIKTSYGRLQLQAAADYLDWLWFGKLGEPLPDSLILLNRHGAVELRGRETHDLGLASDVIPELAPVITAREAFLTSRHDQIISAVENLIRISPQYRILKALTQPVPRAPEEGPLRELEINRRIAQETSDIHRRYGAYPPSGSVPDLQLRAIPGRVERETAIVPGRPRDPFAKVNSWFLQHAQHWWPKTERNGPVVRMSIRNDPRFGPQLTATTSAGETDTSDYFFYGWDMDVGYRGKPEPPMELLDPGRRLVQSFAMEVYDRKQDMPGCLTSAVTAHAELYLRNLLGSAHDFSNAMFLLRELPDPIYLEVPKPRRDPKFPMSENTRIKFSDLNEIAEDLERTAGVVHYRDYDDGTTRLIARSPTDAQLPKLNRRQQYDLVIDFTDEFLSNIGEPYVIGYEAVARTDGRWAFRRADNDPYDPSDEVTLPPEGVIRLVAEYRSLGLTDLAAAIDDHRERQGRLSAADLERLIPEHSSYPITVGEFPLDGRRETRPTLAEFAPYVREERLHVQCSGASLFLAASLELALPNSRVDTISGLVLTQDNRISWAGHAQVRLDHQGRRYVMDAQAPAPLGRGLAKSDLRQRPHRPASGADPTDEPTEATVDKPEVTAQRTAEQARSVAEQVEEILQASYGARNKAELHRLLRPLNPTDPIRRAIAASRNPQRVNVAEVVVALDRYVADRPDVRARAAREAHISDEPELVALLADCLRPLISQASPARQPRRFAVRTVIPTHAPRRGRNKR